MATWINRAIRQFSPEWAFKRERAEKAIELLQRGYDGASAGRRTQGWRKTLSDANAETWKAGGQLRNVARDLVRNNPYAESALSTITDHMVGWGVESSEKPEIWKQWSESTDCDADGINDFYGIQKLVGRTVVESGECLVRRRLRRPADGLALPLQLQVLEPDYLDSTKDGPGSNGGRIVQGVEFNPIGQCVGYWMFREHPGAMTGASMQSVFVPAESVIHVGRRLRPGQVRCVSWFAPVLLRFKDFDDFEDATLMKQKIAACLAVLTSDVDGLPLGTGEIDSVIDSLEPGLIKNLRPGQTVTVVDPPQATDYSEYSKTQLRAIATGLGVTYEDLTGNYDGLPFSAARMSRLRHWARVEGWRWGMMAPQFLDRVWEWAGQTAAIMGKPMPAKTGWNFPPMPFIDPDKEGLAIMRNVRAGIQTLDGALLERGLNPKEHLDQLAQDFKELDKRGLELDIDPRKFTQQGQKQAPTPTATAQPSSKSSADEDEEA